MPSLYDYRVVSIHGEPFTLEHYRGQVLLIVNVASQCGFTRQYAGLEALYRRYREQGFTVLAFPCNQFRHQEPGTNDQIQQFCQRQFGVSFPVFQKTDVNGADAHPVFRWLTQQKSGILGSRRIKWNFTKFLVGRDGQVRARFAPATRPEALVTAVEAALAQPQPT